MAVTLDLSLDDARFLRDQLARQLQEVDDELVHTSSRPMQRGLAADSERLRQISRTLEAAIAASS